MVRWSNKLRKQNHASALWEIFLEMNKLYICMSKPTTPTEISYYIKYGQHTESRISVIAYVNISNFLDFIESLLTFGILLKGSAYGREWLPENHKVYLWILSCVVISSLQQTRGKLKSSHINFPIKNKNI